MADSFNQRCGAYSRLRHSPALDGGWERSYPEPVFAVKSAAQFFAFQRSPPILPQKPARGATHDERHAVSHGANAGGGIHSGEWS